VTQKSGHEVTYFIDAKTYLIIRAVSKEKANGQEQEVVTNFSNYKKTPEGLMMPMSVGLPFGEMTVEKIEVNPKLDESIFTKK
jgi:hypothetical protein